MEKTTKKSMDVTNSTVFTNCKIKVGNQNFTLVDGILYQEAKARKVEHGLLTACIATALCFVLFGEKVALYSATQYAAEHIGKLLI